MSLVVTDLSAGYGNLGVLRGVELEVNQGEILAVVGSNGAGKTTLLRAINSLIKTSKGSVTLDGNVLTGVPTEKHASRGLAHVPENRLVFPSLSVRDNLMLGGWSKPGKVKVDDVLEFFPRLQERVNLPAGSLSGGEQQMVAVARALMADPTAMILDEPSIGLAPKIVAEIMDVLAKLRSEKNLAILLVEQNVRSAFKIADRGVVMHRGRVALSGTPHELLESPEVREAYLGGLD